ncbi:MAG: type II secretion system protein GspN, partial [Deltaproteobacteria bacterium]|nr:type II secretion system protein GspN [Deltaproteobacteria bacterium]
MLLGPSLKMYNVELKAIENERQVLKIPFLKLRPKLFSMLGAVKKVGISAELLEGELSGTVGAGATGSMHVDLSIDSIDLGATNLMKKFLPVDLTAKLDGKVQLELDGETPTKSDGLLKLKIDKLALPAQSVMGLPLSKVNVSEARINVVLSNGKIEFREFEVGKDGKGDDIVGKLTGDGTLNKYLDRSSVNLKALFSISQGVKNSLGILAGMLTPAQTPDGKYAYRISGPLSGLEAMPGQ